MSRNKLNWSMSKFIPISIHIVFTYFLQICIHVTAVQWCLNRWIHIFSVPFPIHLLMIMIFIYLLVLCENNCRSNRESAALSNRLSKTQKKTFKVYTFIGNRYNILRCTIRNIMFYTRVFVRVHLNTREVRARLIPRNILEILELFVA